MADIISLFKSSYRALSKFKSADKSKVISVCINIACLFTLLIIMIAFRITAQHLGFDWLELVSAGVLDIFIITTEVLLCMQIASYVLSRSESVRRHLPYAVITSIIINLLIEVYKLLQLLDVKTSIANLSLTTHTLTAVNFHILLVVILIIGEIILGVYVYQKYFNSKITVVRSEDEEV